MTHEELKTLLTQANEINNSGNYNEAENLARRVLDQITLQMGEGQVEESMPIDVAEIHCSALITLAISAWRKGEYQTTLNSSQTVLDLATQHNFTLLKAKALVTIGLAHLDLSDYQRALDYYAKALAVFQVLDDKSGIARSLVNIGVAHLNLCNYDHALDYYAKALAILEELGDKHSAARNLANMGVVYKSLSDYQKALDFYAKALAIDQELGDVRSIAIDLVNIGVVYRGLSEYQHALEYYGRSLALYQELGDRRGIVANFVNIGIVYQELSDYENALEYYAKALAMNQELGSKDGIARNLGNMGSVLFILCDYPNALEYYTKALAINQELGNKEGIAINLGNIGSTYAERKYDGYDTIKAEEFLLKATSLFMEIGEKRNLYEVHNSLAELYENEKRWEDFAEHFKKYHEIEKEVQSEEAKKQASVIEQRRQYAEREKELEIARTRVTAEKRILNNILPEQITQRLINGENPIADHFDCVSVLFMDIVGFTPLASRITAQQLVHLLNVIFSAADSVMREFGMEKIKTIGDGYMAVAGAPMLQADHACCAAKASMKLLEVMQYLVVDIPDSYGDRNWIELVSEVKVRIGLHCGSVVAGVVGENKFLYDLWGDAVNTAARMESHGEAGRIHVSADFERAVHAQTTASDFHFLPRGEIDIKGKGLMRTYFLEKEKPT